MKKLLLLPSLLILAACGSHSHEIPAAYVSPMEYADYSCKQLSAEMARVSRKANNLAGDIDKNADGDAVAMGAGLVLFWPALFFLDGDHPAQAEYAQLKGRMDALEEVNVKKDCGIVMKIPEPEPVATEPKKKNWNG